MANTAQTPNGGPMISAARNADQEAVARRLADNITFEGYLPAA
jgi:hypothetical protein